MYRVHKLQSHWDEHAGTRKSAFPMNCLWSVITAKCVLFKLFRVQICARIRNRICPHIRSWKTFTANMFMYPCFRLSLGLHLYNIYKSYARFSSEEILLWPDYLFPASILPDFLFPDLLLPNFLFLEFYFSNSLPHKLQLFTSPSVQLPFWAHLPLFWFSSIQINVQIPLSS